MPRCAVLCYAVVCVPCCEACLELQHVHIGGGCAAHCAALCCAALGCIISLAPNTTAQAAAAAAAGACCCRQFLPTLVPAPPNHSPPLAPPAATRAGKCRLVKADGLRALLARRPALRLSACHYLDS